MYFCKREILFWNRKSEWITLLAAKYNLKINHIAFLSLFYRIKKKKILNGADTFTKHCNCPKTLMYRYALNIKEYLTYQIIDCMLITINDADQRDHITHVKAIRRNFKVEIMVRGIIAHMQLSYGIENHQHN